MALLSPPRPDSDSGPHRTLASPSAGGVAAAVTIGALLVAGLWSFVSLKINLATIVDSAGNAADFLSRTWPLDFPPAGEVLALCGETALRQLNYPRGIALALIVVLLCIAVELVSGAIRRSLLGAVTEQRRRPRWMPQRQMSTRTVEPGRISPPWDAARIRQTGFMVLAVVIVVASVWEADITLSQIFTGLRDITTTAGLFWPPETGGISGELFDELLVTIKIALAGTLIGVVLALPVGAMAARNVAPSPRVARVFRIFVVLLRGVPELILAIVLVVITGLGPVAGAIALGVGAMGLLGKLVADSLEETDTRVQLALRATGASRTQVFFAATLPQAAPSFVAHILYQLDVNIRAATLLGIIGAGGIGFYLQNASRVLEFGVVTTVMLMVFATILVVELLALWLRRVVS